MRDMKFGAFLAPHHPIGEHPTLQLRSDLDLVEHLDRLGLDEFWCGEHHSTGWEVIASPELFLAAAAERTHRIRLGTGVVSLPYHHPFMVAQRLVQLDHQSQGRLIFGSGPGALPSDAHTLGVDPMVLRDRQDEAMGIIRRLFEGGDRFSYECEWFKLNEAKLQLLPLQRDMEFAVASMVSPSGMTLAGKHGAGVLSIGSTTKAGLQALPLQWSFAEESAGKHGRTVDRSMWRVVMSWHIAETRDKARQEAKEGLFRHNNEYTVGTLAAGEGTIFKTPDEAVDGTAFSEGSVAVIGTPDDLVERIEKMIEVTGGFGVVIGFVHDWANRADTRNSWDLLARYVVPEVNGMLASYRESNQFVIENRETWQRAGMAIMSKIQENERAREAMAAAAAPAKTALATHVKTTLNGDVDRAEAILSAAMRRRATTAKMAVFETDSGRQIALQRERKEAIYVWVEGYSSSISGIEVNNQNKPGEAYAADQPRSSNLNAKNAPNLMIGKKAWYLKVATIDALKEFMRWYSTS